MITTRCPFCANEIRIPDSILGKKVRCKNTACQQVFTAAAAEVDQPVAAAPTPAPVSPSFSQRTASTYAPVAAPDPVLDWDIPEEPLPRAKPRAAHRSDPLASSPEPDAVSQSHFPNLVRYLKAVRLIALLELAFTLLWSILLFYRAIFDSLTFETLRNWPAYLTAFGVAAIAALVYVAVMAFVEFVHVIISIEANTRRLAAEAKE